MGARVDARRSGEGRVVLAVRDAQLAQMLWRRLEMLGLRVAHYGSAQLALEHVLAEPTLLLIVGGEVLDPSGSWLASQVKRRGYLARCPVIVLVDSEVTAPTSGITYLPKALDDQQLLKTVNRLLVPAVQPLRNAVHAVEVGMDWSWGARSRHLIREFVDRTSAEAYLARLGVPGGWCAALVQVESNPDRYHLGFRSVRTLLVREGSSRELRAPRQLAYRRNA
jgi:hypothetical protein